MERQSVLTLNIYVLFCLKSDLTACGMWYLAAHPSILPHIYPDTHTQEHSKDRKCTQGPEPGGAAPTSTVQNVSLTCSSKS